MVKSQRVHHPTADPLSTKDETFQGFFAKFSRSKILLIYTDCCQEGQTLCMANFQKPIEVPMGSVHLMAGW